MKKRSVVTQKQIAKRAGVSQTVVSLALNGSYDITLSEETRQRVLDVATELGYVPQAAAKSLVQGRSNNIGLILILPHYHIFRDPFIPNIITGISTIVRSQGFRLLVEHIDDLNKIDTIAHMLKGGEVAGLVLSTYYGIEDIVASLEQEDYPIVLLDNSPKVHHTVTIDHLSGVKSAAEHIVSLGHQQIACIPFGPSNPHIELRVGAFKQVLNDNDLELPDAYIRYGDYDPESGYAAMKSLLQIHPLPTAVFGMNDMMAIGAMRAIFEAGMRVPDDIAVVGYDNMRFAPFTNPALTTVHAPEVELGRAAGRMLVDLIKGHTISEVQSFLETQLIVRASCGGG